jgi:uncharacterized delta-60 repeat protein
LSRRCRAKREEARMDDDCTRSSVDPTMGCAPSPQGRALRARFCMLGLVLFGAGAAADTLDGLYDTTWGSGGTVHFSGDPSLFASISVEEIVVEPITGRLLVAGISETSLTVNGWYLGERLPDGSASPVFGESDGSGLVNDCFLSPALCNSPTLTAFTLQADSSITVLDLERLSRLTSGAHALATGSVSGGNGYVTLSGVQINDVKGAFQVATSVLPLPSGKWLVAGQGYYSQATNTNIDFAVVRLNSDFSLDTTFNANTDGKGVTFAGGQLVAFDLGNGNYDGVQQMLVQSDGRILLIGSVACSCGTSLGVARLNADGTLDTSYGGGTGKTVIYGRSGQQYPHGARIDTADRLLVALELDLGNATEIGVLRFLPSGDSDTTFNGSGLAYYQPAECTGYAGRNAGAYALALDSAGRVLTAGYCSFADGSTQFLVARFHGDDGSIDASFANGGVSPGVFAAGDDSFGHDIVIDASGHPLIGGYMYIPAADQAGLARLTYDLIFTNGYERAPRGRLPGQ